MKHYALALFALIGANAALASFVSFDGEWDFYRCGNKCWISPIFSDHKKTTPL